jgi:bifunctional ADP-heptose synthase (sugar kinase/adenylyltransferase)
MLNSEWEMLRDWCNGRVIAANGCFDPLEVHHFHLLQQAGLCGNIVVALNSDDYIRRVKHREPRRLFSERALSLLAIRHVVAVVGFSEDTPIELFRQLQPAMLVRGHSKEQSETAFNLNGCSTLIVPALVNDAGVFLSSTLYQKGRHNTHG